MAEICNKCGKSAVLDSAGNCFHCADVDGEKYKSKKKTIPNVILGLIYVVGVLVHIVIGHNWIGEEMYFDFFPKIFFMCLIIVTWFYVSRIVFAKIYQYWSTSIIELILFFGLMLILPDMLRPSYKYRTFVDVLVVVTIWIAMVLSRLFGFKNNPAYNRMNEVLENEKKLTKKISQIPRYEGGYTQEEYDQCFCNELNRAIELVDELDIDDADKQKVVDMLKNRNIVESDNAGKYGYLKIIKTLFDDCLRIDNGRWVNEVSVDISRFPIDNKDSIVLSEQKYVTEGYFNFFNRVNNEINVPYQYFLDWSNELGITNGFKNFVSEYSGAKSGYIGEKRVAEELEPYSNQLIILPNIRIEVEGNSVENDFIVISPYGVHTLEVKNYAENEAYELLIERDGRWNKVYPHGRIEPTDNVDKQNARHMLYVEKLINQKLGRSIDTYLRLKGMVVIANQNVTVTNNNPYNEVMRYDSIMPVILSGDIVLKEQEMHKIAEIIMSEAKEPIPYEFDYCENYFDLYVDTKVLMDEYVAWKQGNQELLDYVTEYKNNVLSCLKE